jgi:hypothetical protein
MSATQADAAVPATAGARVLGPLAVKLTTAVSVLPAESFTTSVKVPAAETMTFTLALAAPETMPIPAVLVHAYDTIVTPQAGALPPPSMVALPDLNPAGILIAAIGLRAAFTALNAFTMPAPHVVGAVVLQEHSTCEVDPLTHCGVGGVVTGCGYRVALAFIRAIICSGVRFAFAARISAATPETMGAEKLVPRLEFD